MVDKLDELLAEAIQNDPMPLFLGAVLTKGGKLVTNKARFEGVMEELRHELERVPKRLRGAVENCDDKESDLLFNGLCREANRLGLMWTGWPRGVAPHRAHEYWMDPGARESLAREYGFVEEEIAFLRDLADRLQIQ